MAGREEAGRQGVAFAFLHRHVVHAAAAPVGIKLERVLRNGEHHLLIGQYCARGIGFDLGRLVPLVITNATDLIDQRAVDGLGGIPAPFHVHRRNRTFDRHAGRLDAVVVCAHSQVGVPVNGNSRRQNVWKSCLTDLWENGSDVILKGQIMISDQSI